jgi:hypothetical protein
MSTIAITGPSDEALTGLTFTAERGVPSDPVHLKIKNTGVDDLAGLFVVLYAENAPSSGIYVTEGQPVVDERQGRFQITSLDSSGTAGQSGEGLLGQVQPLGHLAVAKLPTIKPGNSVFADLSIQQASSSSGGGEINVKIEAAGESAAFPIEAGVSMVGTGIDSGINQPRSFLISGREVTPTGTPDDQIHVAAGSWLLDGVEIPDASIEDLTLNQLDFNGDALATGESYIAAISQGAAAVPNVTKSVKAVAPVEPAMPQGDLLLAFVTVAQAGTSVISSGDIASDLTYGRYNVLAPPTGLTAVVHAGEAIIANFRQLRGAKSSVVLAAASTNRIWLEYSGAITVNQSADQPSAGAIKLAEAVTDGSNVTSLTDTRTFIGTAFGLTPHASSHATIGSDPVSPASIGALDASSLTDTPLLGIPTAPTAAPGDNSTQVATTAYVDAAVAAATFPTEHVALFSGDGVSQPSVLSPLPAAGTIPDVYIDGLLVIEGGGHEYAYDSGTGQITFTPILNSPDIAIMRWRG